MIHQLPAAEYTSFLAEHPDTFVVDVRSPEEHAFMNLGGINIPLHLIPLETGKFPAHVPLLFYCHHGIRSIQACEYLDKNGFRNIYNLEGGMDQYTQDGDLAEDTL